MPARSLRFAFTLIAPALFAACGPEVTVDDASSSSPPTNIDFDSNPPQEPTGPRISQTTPMCLKDAEGGVSCHLPMDHPEYATELPGIDDAVEVAQALEQGCARHATGRVSCWGWSHHGQLGLAAPLGDESTTAVPMELPEVEVVKLASGHHVVCGIRPSGQAICWGGAYDGPLGDPDVWESREPVEVVGLPDAVDIAATMNRVCAVRASGRVVCWRDHASPVEISGITDAVKVSVSLGLACALRKNGEVACWTEGLAKPMAGVENVVQLSGTLFGAMTCARTAEGGVMCWGVDADGFVDPTLHVIDVDDAIDVSAAEKGVCVLHADGKPGCFNGDLKAEYPFPAWN